MAKYKATIQFKESRGQLTIREELEAKDFDEAVALFKKHYEDVEKPKWSGGVFGPAVEKEDFIILTCMDHNALRAASSGLGLGSFARMYDFTSGDEIPFGSR
jgi:hypothetical protein